MDIDEAISSTAYRSIARPFEIPRSASNASHWTPSGSDVVDVVVNSNSQSADIAFVTEITTQQSCRTSGSTSVTVDVVPAGSRALSGGGRTLEPKKTKKVRKVVKKAQKKGNRTADSDHGSHANSFEGFSGPCGLPFILTSV